MNKRVIEEFTMTMDGATVIGRMYCVSRNYSNIVVAIYINDKRIMTETDSCATGYMGISKMINIATYLLQQFR